jgi:hypothetical protein
VRAELARLDVIRPKYAHTRKKTPIPPSPRRRFATSARKLRLLEMMLSSMSPTQGLSQHAFAISPTSPTSTRGFKRSASSDEEQENGDGDTRPSSARRNTAVKRACNECRQQKVSLIRPLRQGCAYAGHDCICACVCRVCRVHPPQALFASRSGPASSMSQSHGLILPPSSSSATSSKTPL